MFGVTTSDDYQPVAWVGRYPVHVTTLFVIVHVAAMVLACFLVAFGGGLIGYLKLDTAQILHSGRVWQLGTYAFVQSPSGLIRFALEMYMLFAFGREVERFIGRRAFLGLYALLVFAPSVFLTAWGIWQPHFLAGSWALHFGIFVAFATIYPRVQLMFGIFAQWFALVLAAAYSLQLLAYHHWPELTVLWLSVGTACLFIRLRGVGPELVWLRNWRSRSRLKVLPNPASRPSVRRVVEPDNVHDSIDPVLEKISKLGIGSLTATERRALERARTRLLKKGR